jgi:hypothetical protein
MPSVIDDPIINSPFREPARHFKFNEDGITDEIVNGRRPSSHFVPIPRAKKRGKQLQFDTEWTKDRIEPNPVVDRIRQRVGAWRQGGYVGVTGVTSRLLSYWTNPERDKPLFFRQVEALETVICVTEVARKYGDAWIENDLRTANDRDLKRHRSNEVAFLLAKLTFEKYLRQDNGREPTVPPSIASTPLPRTRGCRSRCSTRAIRRSQDCGQGHQSLRRRGTEGLRRLNRLVT